MSEVMEGLPAGVFDMTADAYHADPCPEPSLTSSGIKRLLCGSPAEFAAYHPRLTQWPHLLDETSKAKDIGSIVHALVLGRGCEFVVKDPADLAEIGIVLKSGKRKGQPYSTWTGGAKEWKEEQQATGTLVLDKVDGSSAQAAADSMTELLRKEYGDWPIGDSERTLIWQRDTQSGAIWCRAMLDHLALRHMVILDPKSTDLPINDRALQAKAAKDMWHIQAAWYTEAAEETGEAIIKGRLTFRFPVVEINPPYQSRFVDLSETWRQIGGQRCDRAADIFAKCLRAQKWPDYSPVCSPAPPSWMLSEFEAEELAS